MEIPTGAIHEDFGRVRPEYGISNRHFGLSAAAALALFAFWPWFRGHSPRWLVFWFSPGFALAAWLAPHLLAPLNRAWTRCYRLLIALVTLTVTAAIFYFVFTPVALFLRLAGRDSLRLKPNPKAATYWVSRGNCAAATESLRRQY